MRIRPARVAGLLAAGLLIAALTTDASSVVAPPAARAAPTGITLAASLRNLLTAMALIIS
jgi:endoglycosylceramidase